MSRWYKIVAGSSTFDSTGDPNALNVEMDLLEAPQHAPKAAGTVRIWGLDLATTLNAAKTYTNKKIQVYGGMQKGLPLANPNKQGLLLEGLVWPAFGTWIDTNMFVEFIIPVPTGSGDVPNAANIIHNWPKNQPLAQSMKQSLSQAFPTYTPKIDISSSLVRNYTQTGFYQTLGQYASFIYQHSIEIINNPSYLGVHIWTHGSNIIVSDFTQQSGAKTVDPWDLIGQPSWMSPNEVQVKMVMRGDIEPGDYITLPPTLAQLNREAAIPNSPASNIIQGSFYVKWIRHTGNFRQPDWPSWCSTFDLIRQGVGQQQLQDILSSGEFS
jgi:hypothetical protein